MAPQVRENLRAAQIWPQQRAMWLPTVVSLIRPFLATSTDDCHRHGHRKLIRFSVRDSAHRIAIRFGGIGPRAATAL